MKAKAKKNLVIIIMYLAVFTLSLSGLFYLITHQEFNKLDTNKIIAILTTSISAIISGIQAYENYIKFAPDDFNEIISGQWRKFSKMVYDFGLIVEKYNQTPENVEVDYFEHSMIFQGKDVKHEITIYGKNPSSDSLTRLNNQSSAFNPTATHEMEITATDLLDNQPLQFLCKDDDKAQVKNLYIYFKKPLKKNEEFKVMLSYSLKETMWLVGFDFAITTFTYSKPVKNFKILLKFIDHKPNLVEVTNVISGRHQLIPEDVNYPNCFIFVEEDINKKVGRFVSEFNRK